MITAIVMADIIMVAIVMVDILLLSYIVCMVGADAVRAVDLGDAA